jgi:hypothetical protein
MPLLIRKSGADRAGTVTTTSNVNMTLNFILVFRDLGNPAV